jgi:hypothetical protein
MIAIFVVLWSLWVGKGAAANWAQASGQINQNLVIPYYPAPNRQQWAPRYGHVAIIVPAADATGVSYVYVMGGDTYSDPTTRKDLQPGEFNSQWETGYQNDVWRMTGVTWSVEADIRLKSKYGRKLPITTSQLTWTEVTEGLHPPKGLTNDQWIACQPFFQNLQVRIPGAVNCTTPIDVQWSPRRHHAGVYFQGYMWILGGRAREFVVLPQSDAYGGIIGPRVKDISSASVAGAAQQYTTHRERIYIKSDVWRSLDGVNWELVTPGCRVPQASLIAAGNTADGRFGTASEKCSTDQDCYGAEICDSVRLTCVCSIWSPREQHAVAAYNNYMYVVGGYASVLYSQQSDCGPYACGETDASDYRYYLSDVWRSSDGQSWELITEAAFSVPGTLSYSLPLGRGGHSMIAMVDDNNIPLLWVFGGSGGANNFSVLETNALQYYNDVWVSPLAGDLPLQWTLYDSQNITVYLGNNSTAFDIQPITPIPWSPRLGHAMCVEEASPQNLYTRSVLLYGGYDGKKYLDDVWSWRLDQPGENWRQDFTPEEIYGTGTGTTFHYGNDTSPSFYYVAPLSNVTSLRRFWIPIKPRNINGERYQERPYLSAEEAATLNSVGIMTVQDLADAGLYTILKLRGYDIPQVPLDQRLNVPDICSFRALAIAVVNKCKLTIPNLYQGEKNTPPHIIPVFGGPPPKTDHVKWHDREKGYPELESVDDAVTLLATWDGCTYIPAIQGLFGPNVDGIGYVSQVDFIADPSPIVENLFCRQDPGARAYFPMINFQGFSYALGGKQSDLQSMGDAWYRDADMPVATISTAPRSGTSDQIFVFSANKPGVHFEYRLWDPYNYKEIRPWNAVREKAGIGWLNWRKGGPGSGRYQLYVRAIDPAGNSDVYFNYGRNVYLWSYVSPIPYDIIFGCLAAFLGLCFLAYLEYRRRVKKAAMERYAMKRMRRKFKAMQRDIDGKAVDWRTLYLESKQAEEAGIKTDKRKLKKVRDKNAEKRDKEKKKREKEKELIKKKLQASKAFKEKKKLDSGGGGAAASSKKSIRADGTASMKAIKKGAVLPQLAEGDEEDDEELGKNVKASVVSKPLGGGKAPGVTKVGPEEALSIKVKDELGAGDLIASKNTEQGFKLRKVNKRFKDYEVAVEEKEGKDREEKDDDDDERKKAM